MDFSGEFLVGSAIALLALGWFFFAVSAYWDRHQCQTYEDCVKRAPWWVRLAERLVGR